MTEAVEERMEASGDRPPIRAIVFDLFDTLVDLYMEKLPRLEYRGVTVPASARAMHSALPRRSGIDFDRFAGVLAEVDREFLKSHYKEGLEVSSELRFSKLCEHLGLVDDRLPSQLAVVHMGLLREQVAMPLHHLGLLTKLSERVRIGVCSNFSHAATALAILDDYGLTPYLDTIVFSEEVGIRKPRDEIFAAVLEGMSVDPADALHVGDSLSADVAGAHAVGMRSAWVTRRVVDPVMALERYDGPAPDHRIHDLAELQQILDGS